MQTKVTENEILDAIDKCKNWTESGESQWPRMTYEDGVRDALEWVLGNGDNPMDEE